MGEPRKDALRVNFDRKLKLEFHGVKVTSDAGLLAYRELDDLFGLTDMVACELRDNRKGKNTQHSVRALLRQSVYGRFPLGIERVEFLLEALFGRFAGVNGAANSGRSHIAIFLSSGQKSRIHSSASR